MRIFHLIICLAFGFLGIHRFIVKQKFHGLVFLILAGTTVIFLNSASNNSISSISFVTLLVLIAIDAITVLLTGRYIVLTNSNTPEKNSQTKKQYSDEFKRQVAFAANQEGETLASVGKHFDVSPTLVRNWKNKFSENTAEIQIQNKSNSNASVSINDIQNWLQSSQVEGTIDGDGDLYVSLELSEEVITDKPKKIYLTGSQKLASGDKSETFDFESEVTTNEANWLRSDYLHGVDKDDPSFALNMKLACHICSDLLTIPITVKEGKIGDFPNEIGNIKVTELRITLEDGDYRLEGRLDGEHGFIYGLEASTEEPDFEQSPRAAKVIDDENTSEIYESLWDVKKGDTVYLQLASYAKLDGEIAIGFTRKAEVQEPVIYDDEDLNEDFDRPAVEDVETQEGDIGLFEFQIKRGYVDEEAIEDDEVKELVSDLKSLCESEDFEAATKLLMPSLSFEFGPDELDDEPEKYFSDLDYIEFECTNENTSVKVGVDSEGELLVTITVQFEIALNAGISTKELEEYLPESGAWAAASASPGWGYYESDGENVRFLGLKGESGSSDAFSDETRKTAISMSSEKHEGINIEIPIDTTEQTMADDLNKKNSYSDDFKREVAEAAQKSGATLAAVGEQFGVSPTLVRNWKIKFPEEADSLKAAKDNKPNISVKAVQSWIQNSEIEGTVDGDGDLYVSLETSADSITEEATNLFITGTQKLKSGGKNETSEISDQLKTNETNYLRSDFLRGVGSVNTQFSYNLNCDVYGCSDKVIVPIKLTKGKVAECPIIAGQLELSELNFIFEDGDFRAEGTIKGPNGFIYAAEVLTEEPAEGHVPAANKTPDDESSTEMYEFLWDAKKGDTVFVVLCAFEKLDGKLSCDFTGEAQVEEPTSYDEDDEDEYKGPDVEDVETDEGDIGLFEFQIKRGLVEEDGIEEEDVKKLFGELKQLCEDENYEEAANLLLSNLSFEFGPSDLDDDPERFFANTDYIEFDCTSENTSVKIGYDDCLVVTISVQFEIPLNAGISTAELAEYLPDSGAWASASASPGWGYSGSDGDNVWFLGLKGYGGSNKDSASAKSEKLSDGFEGAVYAITVQRSDEIIDFENISANNGSMRGPLINFFVAYDADKDGYHLVLEGEECFYASSEEYDWEAPKYALENIRNKLKMDLSISDNQVDQLISYLTANITDEEEDIDNSTFTHIVSEVCEINGEDHFADVNEASNRIWVSTSQNLSYINISLNIEKNTLDFDDEALDEKEVVSWSDFVVEMAKSIFDLTVQPVGSTEFKIEVASACAESGMNYKDFAMLYNLDADELNAWAVEFLGEGFV